MPQELYWLPKPLSLSPIRTLIEQSGLDLNDIAVFFDYDQTLTQTEEIPLYNPNCSRKLTSKGIPAKQSKGSVRGSQQTINFLNYLNANHVKWYVNTARGPGMVDSIGMSMNNFKIPFSPIMIIEGQQENVKIPLKYNGVDIGIYNNVISANYDKDVATDYVISEMDTNPKLVIFVDDNALNILTLYDYFLRKPEINFIGVIYEPFLNAEGDHEASMETLRSIGTPIQEINKEYGVGGRRKRKTRRTRRARKSNIIKLRILR